MITVGFTGYILVVQLLVLEFESRHWKSFVLNDLSKKYSVCFISVHESAIKK